jgi:RNA polymerase sigma-70 factor (ECF subfamily)
VEDELARELMLRAGRGDLEAFGELVEAHRAVVLRVVHRYLGRNAADAEDIAQDVFIRAFRARERYQPQARFTTWLLRICSNRCLNYLRDQKHRRALSLDAPIGDEDDPRPELADDGAAMPEELAAASELREAVRESRA